MESISVIIPVYNRPDFLRLALLSLSGQSLLPQEVIVSDDGSDIDMMQVLKSCLSFLPMRVKYVRQEHDGFRLSRARNNAARLAQGELLVFLDQDIVYTKHFLRTFFENQRRRTFLVAYPIRLTAAQTEKVTDEMVLAGDFLSLLEKRQLRKVRRQYREELLYHYLKKWHLRQIGPKLRGGVFAVNREDFLRVNGFDESYCGWGNEDDDLGHRLHRSGVIGRNPFLTEFPLHLYHPPYREGEKRVNQQYYLRRKLEIHKEGRFRCENGVDQPREEFFVVLKECEEAAEER